MPDTNQPRAVLAPKEPPLLHLKRMTDDTGLFQHAKFILPDREHGYCTDDNARAALFMTDYCQRHPKAEALELFNRYLSFTCHAQLEDGNVRNFMDYNRNWWNDEPNHDAFGRTLWAFGAVIASPPMEEYVPIIQKRFDRALDRIAEQSIRGKAYCVFALEEYLRRYPDDSRVIAIVQEIGDELLGMYKGCRDENWRWFEDMITYDNAILPDALMSAGRIVENNLFIDTGKEACDFLLENTVEGDHFSFVGCDGWLPRGGEKARFDQQALEAVSTARMLRTVYSITKDARYNALLQSAAGWFLGENDCGIPLYDPRSGGCYDGLEPDSVNLNQGAESLLSFLQTLLWAQDKTDT